VAELFFRLNADQLAAVLVIWLEIWTDAATVPPNDTRRSIDRYDLMVSLVFNDLSERILRLALALGIEMGAGLFELVSPSSLESPCRWSKRLVLDICPSKFHVAVRAPCVFTA
jgi:hypothetical protein